jgi:hypothetical protein
MVDQQFAKQQTLTPFGLEKPLIISKTEKLNSPSLRFGLV